MKRSISTFIIQLFILAACFGQYDKYSLVLSGGINYSKYLGQGENENHFTNTKPGVQLEFTLNTKVKFEWIIWGIAYYQANNTVEGSSVPVTFTTTYYTEFLFYQKETKNPWFFFFGYDYVQMKFPSMEKADGHHNITFGGGWNLRLSPKLFLQFKVKPFFITDNSFDQLKCFR